MIGVPVRLDVEGPVAQDGQSARVEDSSVGGGGIATTGMQFGSRHEFDDDGGARVRGPVAAVAVAVAVASAAALHRIQSSSIGVLPADVVASAFESYARPSPGDDARAAAAVEPVPEGRHSASSQHHARWLFAAAAAAAAASLVAIPAVGSIAAHSKQSGCCCCCCQSEGAAAQHASSSADDDDDNDDDGGHAAAARDKEEEEQSAQSS